MGLLGNGSVLLKSTAAVNAGVGAQTGHAGNFHNNGRYRNRHWFFNKQSSQPDGYNLQEAIKPNQKSTKLGVASQTDIIGTGTISNAAAISAKIAQATGLTGSGTITNANMKQVVSASGTLAGVGSVTADLKAVAVAQATGLTGSGTVSTANLKSLIPMTAGLSGSASLSPNLKGTGSLSADITPFTDLSPENLAATVMATEVETGYSLEAALRLILSSAAGKLSGAETTTVTIRNVTDGSSRIVATVDANGNRTAVTYDITDD